MTQPLVALCHNGVKVKDAPLENITIKELAKQLVAVKTGEKDGAYFIRTGVIDSRP